MLIRTALCEMWQPRSQGFSLEASREKPWERGWKCDRHDVALKKKNMHAKVKHLSAQYVLMTIYLFPSILASFVFK